MGDKVNNLIGVVIGASKDAIHTIEKAKLHGIYVYALDGDPNAEGMLHADETVTVDISDTKAVEKVIELVKPDFVLPIPIGRYLTISGHVNEKYNLKGIKELPVMQSTDKYDFHKALYNHGLRNIQCYLLKPYEEKLYGQHNIQYPAIIKPRYGSGSRDVYYCCNKEQLKIAEEKIQYLNEDFILEQAAEGMEYSVDGAVIDGNLIITLLRKKFITPLPIRQPISSFSIVDNEENKKLTQRVYEKVTQVVKVLMYNDCLLNVDLIINNDDVFIIEISPRPSGHNLHNVFVPISTGIDIAEEYIKFLKGESFNFKPKKVRQLQICFFNFENRLISYIPDEIGLKNSGKCNLQFWQCNISKGDYLKEVKNGHSIMGRGFFIVEGFNEEDLIQQSKWILGQFR